MSKENHSSGNKVLQAVRKDFQTVRQKLPRTWLSDILSDNPQLDTRQQIERLKNIRIGRTTPTPDEVKLFEAILPDEPGIGSRLKRQKLSAK